MSDTDSLYESLFQMMLVDIVFGLLTPVLFGISMFLLWRCLRRAGSNPAFQTLATGFGLLFLSLAIPFAMGVIVLVALGDSGEHLSELWFDIPITVLTAAGTVQIIFGTRKLSQQLSLDE